MAKTELSELGVEEGEFTETTSQLRDLVKGLTGFDIQKDENSYKDIYDILLGIGKQWDKLTDLEQASLAEKLGGKRGANALFAVLQNVEGLEAAYATATGAAGSAAKEQENYAQSIQYSIDQTKASLQELAVNFLSSDNLKAIIEFANKLLQIVNSISDSLGSGFSIFTSVASIDIAKGVLGNQGALASIMSGIAAKRGTATNSFGANIVTALAPRTKEVAEEVAETAATEGVKTVTKVVETGLVDAAGKPITKVVEVAAEGGKAAGEAMAQGAQEVVKTGASGLSAAATASIIGAIAAIGITAYIGYKEYEKKIIDSAKHSAEQWDKSRESITKTVDEYEKLKTQLDTETLSDQERIDIKEKIYSIQQQITDEYGRQVENIDLINGSLESQKELLESISAEQAKESLRQDRAGYDKAIEAMTKQRTLSASSNVLSEDLWNSPEFQNIFKEFEDSVSTSFSTEYIYNELNGAAIASNQFGIEFSGTTAEIAESSDRLKEKLYELQDALYDSGDTAKAKAIGDVFTLIDNAIKPAKNDIDTFSATYRSFLEQSAYASGAGRLTSDLQQAVKEYNEALASGDVDYVHYAKSRLTEAENALKDFKPSGAAAQYWTDEIAEDLFGSITDQVDTATEKFLAFEQIVTNSDIERKLRKYENGGNASLINRPIVSTEQMMRAGYDIGDGSYATTYIQTFSNESGTKAVNLTPIFEDMYGRTFVVDEDNLQRYADALFAEDYAEIERLFGKNPQLQVGNVFFGPDATEQADATAQAIHELQVQYYLLENEVFSDEQIDKIEDYMSALGDTDIDSVDAKQLINSKDVKSETAGAQLALKGLAKELDVVNDPAGIDRMIQALIRMGYVVGSVGDNAVVAGQDMASSYKATADSVTGTITAFDKINSIVNSITTGKSLSYEDFTAMFNEESLKPYIGALEYVNGTIQLNTERVKELNKAKAEEELQTIATNKALEQTQYMKNVTELKALQQQYKDMSNDADEQSRILGEINKLTSQNDAIFERCRGYDILSQAIRESTGEYQAWLAAQNAGNSGDMAKDAVNAMEVIRDVFNTTSDNYGKTGKGNTQYQAAIDFLIPDTVDKDDDKSVKSYLDSLNSLLVKDSDGKITGFDIGDFLERAVAANRMTKVGNEYRLLGSQTMEEFAEGMGLALPLVQAIFGEIDLYKNSFTFHDDLVNTTADMLMAATQAQNILAGIDESFGDIDLDFGGFEDSEQAIREIDRTIASLQSKSHKLGFEVDSDEYRAVSEMIEYLVFQKNQLQAPLILSLNRSKLSADAQKFQQYVYDLQYDLSQREYSLKVGADTTEADRKIEEVANQIRESPFYAKLNLDEEASAAEIYAAIQALDIDELSVLLGVDKSELESAMDEVNNENPDDKQVTVDANTRPYWTATDRVRADRFQNKTVTVDADVSSANTKISQLQSRLNEMNYLHNILGLYTGTVHASGSALVNGNAKAHGDWGLKSSQRVLIGELGPEIVVDPHTGKWRTYGDNGAEFAYIPKDAIVFNHLQSEELLRRGFVNSRALIGTGRAKASGTAMYGGTGTGGAIIWDKNYGKKPSSSSSSRSGSNSGGGSSPEIDKAFEEIKDWVEVLLQRIARIFDNFKDMGEYWSIYNNQIRELNSAINQAKTNIEKNKQAYNRYIQETANVGLSEEYARKVRNGELDIESITDEDLKTKIQYYTEW